MSGHQPDEGDVPHRPKLDEVLAVATARGEIDGSVRRDTTASVRRDAEGRPWLMLEEHDELGSGSTASPISDGLGTCLTDHALVVGGVATDGRTRYVEVACNGLRRRLDVEDGGAWVTIFEGTGETVRLDVREVAEDGQTVHRDELEFAPDPAGPRLRSVLRAARTRLRRSRSGSFPRGTTTY